MFGHRPAAAANDIDAEILDEAHHPLGEIRRIHGKDGFAIDGDRHAGVRQRADEPRPFKADLPDNFTQFRRAKGAVDAQDIHFGIRFDGGHKRRWIGPRKHVGAAQIKRRLHHDRQPSAHFGEDKIGGVDDALDAQQVLLRLDEQDIHPAGHEAAHLLGIAVEHCFPIGVSKGNQLGAGSDGADDIAWPIRCLKLQAGAAGDLGGDFVVLKDALGHLRLGHHDLVGAEGVGLNGIASNGQKVLMDFLNDLRAGEVQNFGDIFLAHPIALQIESAQLKVGSHRAVKHDHTPTNQFKKRQSHGHALLSSKDTETDLPHPMIGKVGRKVRGKGSAGGVNAEFGCLRRILENFNYLLDSSSLSLPNLTNLATIPGESSVCHDRRRVIIRAARASL